MTPAAVKFRPAWPPQAGSESECSHVIEELAELSRQARIRAEIKSRCAPRHLLTCS